MRRLFMLLLMFGLCAAWGKGEKKGSAAPNTMTANEQKDGWILLFDGKSLDAWNVTPELAKVWRVVDGGIKCDSSAAGGTLLSMIRNPRPRTVAAGEKKKKGGGGSQGYEVQIRDKNPGRYSGGSYLTGSLVNVAKAPETAKIKPGEWNTFEITAQGDHFVIIYNGVKVVDAYDSRLTNGTIGLQLAHPEDARGADIEFRNLKVTRLPGGTVQ